MRIDTGRRSEHTTAAVTAVSSRNMGSIGAGTIIPDHSVRLENRGVVLHHEIEWHRQDAIFGTRCHYVRNEI